jgi:hypothetical protein
MKTYYIRYGKHGRIHRMRVDQDTGFSFTDLRCHVDDIKAACDDYGTLPEHPALRQGYIMGWRHDGQRICKFCFGDDIKKLPRVRMPIRRVQNRTYVSPRASGHDGSDERSPDMETEASAFSARVLAGVKDATF